MTQVISEIIEKLESLHGLFQQAIQVGDTLMNSPDEELVKYTDLRHRILNKTENLAAEVKERMNVIMNDSSISGSEKAYVSEKRSTIFDLEPFMRRQNLRIQQNVAQRLKACRERMAGNTKRVHAIAAYMKAPQARPLIS